MKKDTNPEPFLKWAGGKRKLLKTIEKYLPSDFNTYYEPFVGSGALLFHLTPQNAVINDINSELINCYEVVKLELRNLIICLKEFVNTEESYYYIRNLDRLPSFSSLSNAERAARFIYLNRTCYNGLWRVNKKGEMNTPYGRYNDPKFLNQEHLENVNVYLNSNNISLLCCDFKAALRNVKCNDFIYFDPPYVALNKTSSFTQYSKCSFSYNDQTRLKLFFDELTNIGCKCMLSNSLTTLTTELYNSYKIIEISASRSINSNVSKRGKVKEILVINY